MRELAEQARERREAGARRGEKRAVGRRRRERGAVVATDPVSAKDNGAAF